MITHILLLPKDILTTRLPIWRNLLELYIFIFVSMFSLLSFPQPVSAQAVVKDIPAKPLQISDTIPEELWHIPLQIVNHPDKKDTITLNEYRGKLIILDFWATWCGACIGSIPKNIGIEEEFPSTSIIPVTEENSVKVLETIKNNHILKTLKFSSVINGSILTSVFPHRSVPHLVWIDQKGIVVAITYPNDLNRTNIKKLLSTGSLTFNKKADILDYDLNEPLTLFKRPDFSSDQITRSTLTKYLAGIPSSIGISTDTSTGKRWFKATNMGIKNLLMWTDPKTKSIPRKLWDIDGNNLFCYELFGSQDIIALRKAVKEDIERLFGITMKLVSKDTVQLVLEPLTPHFEDSSELNGGKVSAGRIVYLLNKRIDLPFVTTEIDKEKIYAINEEILNSASLTQINSFLKGYGLRLRKEMQQVDFLRFKKVEGGLL